MQQETGWRGSPELWLDAAYETLIETGVDAVKVQVLSKKLRLSRGSFYWMFRDREALLEALLDRWRTKNTEGISKQAAAYAETIEEALLNVFDCWLDRDIFDFQFEFAVRSWALQSPSVMMELSETDEQRVLSLTDLFLRFGMSAEMADVSARALYQGQIGYISMGTKENIEMRMARIPKYIKLFTGKEPSESELNRFYARHKYRSESPAK
jgi:AcrR family transcriptional regulator